MVERFRSITPLRFFPMSSKQGKAATIWANIMALGEPGLDKSLQRWLEISKRHADKEASQGESFLVAIRQSEPVIQVFDDPIRNTFLRARASSEFPDLCTEISHVLQTECFD